MKRLSAVVLGAFLVAAALTCIAPSAHAAEAKEPTYGRGIGFTGNPSFIGIKAARLMNTATITSLVTGPGLLYAICPSGGTLGKYTVAFDSLDASALSLTAALSDGGNPSKYLLSPLVFTTNDSTSAQHGQSGCWVPPWPVRFEQKLIGANNDTGHRALFYYRLDSGANP